MTTQRKWREWLTKDLLALWLKDGRYRGLKFVTTEHQNDEYRICVDARIATDAPVDIALGLFTAITTASVFTNVFVDHRRRLDGNGERIPSDEPGYLVLGVGLYALVFTTARPGTAKVTARSMQDASPAISGRGRAYSATQGDMDR
jgi:vitamin B12/bleomycin/antimicrobial peptide transport system ATP-binding/permease protein